MIMRRFVYLLFACLLMHGAVEASPFTYYFTGTLQSAFYGAAAGAQVTGSYTFDPDLLQVNPQDAFSTSHDVTNPANRIALMLVIPSVSVADPYNTGNFYIIDSIDNPPGPVPGDPGYDQVSLNLYPNIEGIIYTHFLDFIGPSSMLNPGFAASNSSIPLNTGFFSSFTSGGVIELICSDLNCNANTPDGRITLDQVYTPEPGTGLLIGSLTAFSLALARKRSYSSRG
jgi:hypothetical protein